MEPTSADINAVAQAIGQPQPTQQPTQQPAQQQPEQVTPQPSPVSQPAPETTPTSTEASTDPFAALYESLAPTQAPAQTTETTPQQTEVQPNATPTEPGVTTQPTEQPAQQPTQQPTTEETPQQTYDQYIESIMEGLPTAPEQPDASQVNAEDPASIKKFFDDLMTTAEKRFEANYVRNQAVKNSEQKLWNDAFDKYQSLRSNKNLRDMVHAIRKGEFDKGIAITPIQAADKLLQALQGQYRQGVADNQVQTTIEQVQPVGGGSTPVATSLDSDKVLLAVQQGGEAALAQILDAQFKASGS